MHLIRVQVAVILGIVLPQISSISVSPAPPDCVAAVDVCMSDLCEKEKAFNGETCDDEGCQIKGSYACNMTIQSVLESFPSMRGCVCSWQEELCGSIQALATQCQRKAESEQKRRAADWQSSSLINYVYDGAGSCLDQITVCVSDAVCNRHLAPVLQACLAHPCTDRCQEVVRHFYGSMPHNVAEMLVMCECEDSAQSCQEMRATLQRGLCGEKRQVCQEAVNQCVGDSGCRGLLKTFQDKCWKSEEAKCSDSELQKTECLTLMDPALILGSDAECTKSFVATVGTALHSPCSCKGVYGDDLLTCNRIHSVLHNRSHFKMPWKGSNGSSKAPEFIKPETSKSWPADYLMYALVTVLLVGVVILMPLAVMSKIWMFRRTDQTKFQPVEKSNLVL
ncbi:GDNF family receptor alpha-like [Betta splendens]|uniref:GDNF family receptor alpha-like n=1 Tax=Betta splendens TaxID=158456 RepID=A0A6P7KJ70_BETSP|nr:GDNF family receptor alpha-like [Betta splendens]